MKIAISYLVFLVALISAMLGAVWFIEGKIWGLIFLIAGASVITVGLYRAHKYSSQFTECSACKGTGIKETCPNCEGTGMVKKEKEGSNDRVSRDVHVQ